MLDTYVRDLVKELFGFLGIFVNPGLALSEQLCATPFHHVAEQGPGRTAEANQGHSPLQLLARQGDGLVYIFKLVGNLDIPPHDLAILAVLGVLQRVREVRPFLVHHLYIHTHGLRDDKNVRKYDSGIEKTSIALDGLESDRGCDFGVAAAFEKVTVALCLVVLGEIPTRCH